MYKIINILFIVLKNCCYLISKEIMSFMIIFIMLNIFYILSIDLICVDIEKYIEIK